MCDLIGKVMLRNSETG